MANYGNGDHFGEYAGLRVHEFGPDTTADEDLPAADSVAWRVATRFDGDAFSEVFERFLSAVDTGRVTALLVGYWHMSSRRKGVHPVAALTAAADRFPGLRALFVGDIVREESETSWIEPADITPLLAAYPRLERFGVRSGRGLTLNPIRSEHLRELRVQSGGLPAKVVRSVAASELPNLDNLELWLGEAEYGGDATVDDLAPILSGERLPALRHLGLMDAEIQDEIAAAVAQAPVVARLESLDLSMGVLTDGGGEALLSGRPLTHLRRLGIHHHFLSDEMMERIRTALPGVDVDLADQEIPDEDDDGSPYYFVWVGE